MRFVEIVVSYIFIYKINKKQVFVNKKNLFQYLQNKCLKYNYMEAQHKRQKSYN
jgi:hypothetical protein